MESFKAFVDLEVVLIQELELVDWHRIEIEGGELANGDLM